MSTSPYFGVPISEWASVTDTLIEKHPLDVKEIVEISLKSWEDILESSIGSRKFRIGKDIFPKPQIMGFLLNEVLSLELEHRYPGIWRGDVLATDKDLVYEIDNFFSTEMKTSSSKGKIYGNRSYAQVTTENGKLKKSKSGYYLAINFEKFGKVRDLEFRPVINLIRFGWLDHEDWLGQKAASGQQARLSSEVEMYKLKTIYSIY